MARRYRKSDSGNYRVEITRVWPHLGINLKPGARLIVNEATLTEMLEDDGLVASVQPSA
jgi:hypothetical protein